MARLGDEGGATQGQGQGQSQRPGGASPRGVEDSIEIMPCQVCGGMVGTMRCKGCRVVAYCGKEHQREHWKVHKKLCKEMGSGAGGPQ